MLKIIGRTPASIRVSETRQAPHAAREIQFRCSACNKYAYALLPYAPTPGERQRIIKKALDEHRLVCKVGGLEQGRSYEIWYPRA